MPVNIPVNTSAATFPFPSRENTLAVVILYNPPTDIAQRIARLLPCAALVHVVDNTPSVAGSTIPPCLLPLFPQPIMPGLIYLSLHQNQGVAAALNASAAMAQATSNADLKWLLMLDQDSDPPASLLPDLAAAITATPNHHNLALLGINYQDISGSGKTAHPIRPASEGITPAKAVITSGSLLRLDAAAKVGPFRNDFFIDEVDHEYALRLRRAGYQVALASSVIMPHNLGNMRRISLLGLTVGVSNHPPSRRYYMARNRIALAKTYLFFDPAFVLSRLALTAWESLLILLFENQKISKLWHTLKGIAHGIMSRMGPLTHIG